MANYKFIAGDGKEYGPYTAEQMRQFLTENRLVATSQVSADGGPFQPASSFPELNAGPGQPMPGQPMPGQPMPGQPMPNAAEAKQKVNGPAIFMMITAGLNMAFAVLGLVMAVLGNTALAGAGMMGEEEAIMRMITGIPGNVLGIITGIIILIGASKMRKLESYGFAMTASILSIVCCPCCVGLGAGIWSVVVLSNAQVKASFR